MNKFTFTADENTDMLFDYTKEVDVPQKVVTSYSKVTTEDCIVLNYSRKREEQLIK